MVGVVLFTLVLIVFGFILSSKIISGLVKEPEGDEAPNVVKRFLIKIQELLENKSISLILALTAIVIGLWNFFAPDFGAFLTPTIVGALIPSLILLVNGAVLYPHIIEIFNVSDDKKGKYYDFISKYKDYVGLATLVIALLHILLYKQVFF